MGMLAALVSAMRNVLLTYDGWYSPIYLAEENTDPGRTLPRALIGGTVVLIVLYVAVNAALLRVLPLSALASSDLPAAAAAHLVFPRGGGELVTLISLLTVLSLVNATLLLAPRVLFAIGRDGLFTRKAAAVSAGGTPRLALAVSSAVAIVLILSGTFEQIIALATVLFLLNYISAYAALFVLRRREPDLPRPYRAFGFPFTTAIVLVGSVLALIAAVLEDLRSALIALLLLAACAPIYRRDRAPQAADGSARSGRMNQSKSVGSPGSSAWREHALDLRGGGASDRQRRQLVARKEGHFAGLDARAGAAARELADEEQLVDRIEVLRTIALAIVVDGGELDRTRLEPGLLAHLAHRAHSKAIRSHRPSPPAASRRRRSPHERAVSGPRSNAAARTSTLGVA